MSLSIAGYIQQVRDGSLDPKAVADEYLSKIAKDTTNSFVRTHPSYIDDVLSSFVERPLAGVPLGIKDIIMTKGYETSCGSDMLKGYIPPYSATCFEKLEKAGGLMLGKTNMDDAAMGSSGETSAFGPTLHPLDHTRVPGGSSSGSAAAVAGDLCVAALGTDTGGSVRLPASLSGIVGMKPTYGRISRYGVQAMTSSFDQIGTMTKTVEDTALLLDAMAGNDKRDAQTSPKSDFLPGWYTQGTRSSLSGVRFALPKQFMGEGLDAGVETVCNAMIEKIKRAGGQVDIVDIPILSYAVPIYYIIVPAQISSNISRLDGIRYGHSKATGEFATIYDYYADVRSEGLGKEVQRRILTGSYVLSAGFYDAYYAKAQAARTKMRIELKKIYKQYDMILGPTSPTPAWKIGEKMDDPIAMYLTDVYTCTANMTGLPAISIPAGSVDTDGVPLPVGVHLMANHWEEAKMLYIAGALELLASDE